jgi:hypothetical protein
MRNRRTSTNPNVKEDTLREIRRLLTGDQESFRPASFSESAKYNFLGITPQREEQSGGFGRALIDETKSQFKQLFGIKTSEEEREKEITAEAERIKKLEQEEKRKRKLEEQNASSLEASASNLKDISETTKAMLAEVTTLRKVSEGSVKREKRGRYRDVDTGKYIAAEKVRQTTQTSGTDVPTTEEGNAAILAQLEKLNEGMEDMDVGGDGGINVNVGRRSFLDRLLTRNTGKEAAKKTGTRTATSKAGQTILQKIGVKGAGKAIAKKIPIIGALAGIGFGAQRLLRDGDAAGAGMEVASGLASTLPGFGTAGSLAIDAGLIARDVQRAETLEQQAMNNSQPPVVVNNVDASTNPVMPSAQQQAPQTNATITLRDTHGSHLRFQESRLNNNSM